MTVSISPMRHRQITHFRIHVIRCPILFYALDQSAAFDCVDHETLVSRLEHTFGVLRCALDWICSYLEARSTFVRWKQISPDVFPLDTGVSQGASLGPFLFSLYIAPLSAVINSFVNGKKQASVLH